MRVPASATDCPLPKLGIVTIGRGHLLALTILIGPDCSTTICLPSSLPRTPQQPVSSSARTMSGMSAWVMSDTTRWRRALTGSLRKSMVVTENPPRAQGFVSGRASPSPLREPLVCAFDAGPLTEPSDQTLERESREFDDRRH